MRLCAFCCFVLVFIFCVGAFPVAGNAQLTVTETQSLSFGTIITRDFNNVSRATVRPNNTMSYDVDTIGLVPGQRAEYSVTGGPPNTMFTVTIDASTDLTLGANPIIRLDQFRVRPNTLQTNGAGVDTFRIGARARTLGGGSVYADGTYNATYDLTVQF